MGEPKSNRKRILTGDRPTGKLHLGHYVGSLQNRVKLQHDYETYLLIADIQALTTHWDKPEMLKQAVYDVAMDNLAVGIDPEVTTLCVQSMIPEIAELTVLYGLFTNMNKLRHNPTTKAEAIQYGMVRSEDEAAHRDMILKVEASAWALGFKTLLEVMINKGLAALSELRSRHRLDDASPEWDKLYEDAVEKRYRVLCSEAEQGTAPEDIFKVFRDTAYAGFDQLTYGFFGYPLSQAADITFVQAHLVPVGEDQKPHIELTRDVVGKFNQLYGGGKEIIPMPKALIGDVPRLAGLDGDTKMSKSLGNVINLADPPEAVKDTVWKAITDKDKIRKGDPGNPEICNVFKYHRVFNRAERVEEIDRDCRSGVLGCVECKGRLTDVLNELLAPIRERRRPYEENPERVREILLAGTQKARILGKETLGMVKEAMKLDYF